MPYSERWKGRTCIIGIEGDFDELSAEAFRMQADAALEKGGASRLIVNMKDVTFIDSSGLGALLGRFKRYREGGGEVCVVAPPPHIRALLELSGVPKVIPIYRTEGEALRGVN